MKYYEMHEAVYRKLKDEGKLSWDRSSTFEEMWAHSTNVFLRKFLSAQNRDLRTLSVLDLGTGTGTSALFCAKEGAQVVGVEVSASALSIAQTNAQALGVSLEFIEGDVLSLSLDRKFDIVIDSTILHCIVGAGDRRRFFEVVKKHLKDEGLFFVNTMIADAETADHFPKKFFHFEDGVLWSTGMNEVSERKTFGGKSYFPHRTLLTQEEQVKELKDSGFYPLVKELTPTEDRIRCLVGLFTSQDS